MAVFIHLNYLCFLEFLVIGTHGVFYIRKKGLGSSRVEQTISHYHTTVADAAKM
jgi:hypothetical protein